MARYYWIFNQNNRRDDFRVMYHCEVIKLYHFFKFNSITNLNVHQVGRSCFLSGFSLSLIYLHLTDSQTVFALWSRVFLDFSQMDHPFGFRFHFSTPGWFLTIFQNTKMLKVLKPLIKNLGIEITLDIPQRSYVSILKTLNFHMVLKIRLKGLSIRIIKFYKICIVFGKQSLYSLKGTLLEDDNQKLKKKKQEIHKSKNIWKLVKDYKVRNKPWRT